MNNSINISRRTSTAELISILFAVCALLFARLNKSIFAASHPVWVCGLKLPNRCSLTTLMSHTLYGCVD